MIYTKKEIYLNISELIEDLNARDKRILASENIIRYASDDALVQELINRGFEVTKG